jgi:hypothetical protein
MNSICTGFLLVGYAVQGAAAPGPAPWRNRSSEQPVRGRTGELGDVVDHVRLVVEAVLGRRTGPALAATGGEQALHASDPHQPLGGVAGGEHDATVHLSGAVAALDGQ